MRVLSPSILFPSRNMTEEHSDVYPIPRDSQQVKSSRMKNIGNESTFRIVLHCIAETMKRNLISCASSATRTQPRVPEYSKYHHRFLP